MPWIFLGLLLTASVATCMLVVDYTRPTPVFCDEIATGCGAVKASTAAAFFGVPTPILGLVSLVLLGILSVSNIKLGRILFALAGSFAIAFALFFVYTQFKLNAFCKYCLVVDACSVLMGGVALFKLALPWAEPRWAGAARVVSLGLIASLTVGFGLRYVPPACAGVRADLEATPKGVVCIVDFLDFECPFCREAHKSVHAIIAREGKNVRLVRKHIPLRMHPHALPAARAAICAARLGKEDAYADKLMEIDPETFTDEVLTRLATDMQIDGTAFKACLTSPETEARIQSDRADYKACKGAGLPTLYVGSEGLVGLQSLEELDAALTRAKER
jgi:uncharacterized membrane protein/predicted DsbA family dithiol-disulfide isomerase